MRALPLSIRHFTKPKIHSLEISKALAKTPRQLEAPPSRFIHSDASQHRHVRSDSHMRSEFGIFHCGGQKVSVEPRKPRNLSLNLLLNYVDSRIQFFFLSSAHRYGVSQAWTKGALNIFLSIIIMGYAGSMAFLIKEQLRPWYYWWTNTHNIQLRINSNLASIETRKKLFSELTLNEYDSTDNTARDNDLLGRSIRSEYNT